MVDFSSIDFDNRNISETISLLKDKSVSVPSWDKLKKDYEPTLHAILSDTTTLKDKIRSDGQVDKSARIIVGLEKLHVKRMAEFTFSIPVKRVYSNIEGNDTRKQISKAIEAIYRKVHIYSENIKRAKALYASCEIFTVWYAVKKTNTLYGFQSDYKLKCKTFSPMSGVHLYPLLNEMDDMLAMSFEYTKKVKDKEVTYFETYTEDKHYIWKQGLDSGGWESVLTQITEDGEIANGEDIVLKKIPGIYAWKSEPVYDGLSSFRSEIEYSLSRNSNVIAYNSAPLLKVSGGLKGQEEKGEAYRIFRCETGGDVSYVSWSQSIEALKYHVDKMEKLYWAQAQIPDISFENMKGLGNIGYEARQALLTDAHLRIDDEKEMWIEFLERECNVIKAFLKVMNTKWKDEIDNVVVEHVITPYIQNDELADINKRMKANGNKPIESQLESIQKYGKSSDAAATLKQIQEENAVEASQSASAFNLDNQVL
ncbi:phage portal protein [Prevotella sp. KH2C16]|uniref:phage portal protein n=1 Tax=Prevotella sp. KH2C16 TaxID=1855325 RepID=UPI0008E1C544|nr:phage portal protein [Prevotella sp. KH2C16]SFG56475.1 Phage portal protein, SPP1 Gp6-like [Prevotella sp. KH2C16]